MENKYRKTKNTLRRMMRTDEDKAKMSEANKGKGDASRFPSIDLTSEANINTPENMQNKFKVDRTNANCGLKKGNTMKERKKIRQSLEEIMSADYAQLQSFLEWDFKTKKNIIPEEVAKWFEDRGETIKVQDAVILATLKNAIFKGDIRAIEFVRDTLGEKPKIEVESNANIKNVTGFNDLANKLYGEEKEEKKKEE
jgi:hypothetical protein